MITPGSSDPASAAEGAGPVALSSSLVLLFDRGYEVWLRRAPGTAAWSASWEAGEGENPAGGKGDLEERLENRLGQKVKLTRVGAVESEAGGQLDLFFGRFPEVSAPGGGPGGGDAGGEEMATFTLEELSNLAGADPGSVSPALAAALPEVLRVAYRVPYLDRSESAYIFPFRPEKRRNQEVYQDDARSRALYQSRLCAAIKAAHRTRERTSGDSAVLDFGAVTYVLPSHFGFCLGVQNAIERAYETLAENPGRRVFMLSDLIHNPFVNADLSRRGLRYLQSDLGEPARDPESGELFWDTLGREDVVIIPAFGATDEDKARLVAKGIEINRHDATCMLVEKVWKAARRYGREGYTVVIHGKAEHEETRTTFSNATKCAPAVVVRNLAEARVLAEVIRAPAGEGRRERFAPFLPVATPGFDPDRDLRKLAVVNQTTLLRNETLEIIALLHGVLAEVYGEGQVEELMERQRDTLCYATQVNQDALGHALRRGVDHALVIGGQNSSNTWQLFRICRAALGERAHYIQSEANLLGRAEVEHFHFAADPASPSPGGNHERRTFMRGDTPGPARVLVTGGASCPDGLIQQVITRINSFFDPAELRSMDEVLAGLEGGEPTAAD